MGVKCGTNQSVATLYFRALLLLKAQELCSVTPDPEVAGEVQGSPGK